MKEVQHPPPADFILRQPQQAVTVLAPATATRTCACVTLYKQPFPAHISFEHFPVCLVWPAIADREPSIPRDRRVIIHRTFFSFIYLLPIPPVCHGPTSKKPSCLGRSPLRSREYGNRGVIGLCISSNALTQLSFVNPVNMRYGSNGLSLMSSIRSELGRLKYFWSYTADGVASLRPYSDCSGYLS